MSESKHKRCRKDMGPSAACTETQLATPVHIRRRVGLDFGGVIVMHKHDWDKKMFWETTKESEVRGALEAVARLVRHFGADNVCIISSASPRVEKSARYWLRIADFFSATGMLPGNVHFVREATGPAGKGPLAAKLCLTDFVDDSDVNLQAILRDDAGNSGAHIAAADGKLIRFSRSGSLRPPPLRQAFGDTLPANLMSVTSWAEVLQILCP